MFSDEDRDRLKFGKYTWWAADLSQEHVEYVLWLVGELGMRALPVMNALKQADPEVAQGTLQRALQAIEGLRAAVILRERLDVSKGDPWRLRPSARVREPEQWQPEVRQALDAVAPAARWQWVVRDGETWDAIGKDANGRRVVARVTDGVARVDAEMARLWEGE